MQFSKLHFTAAAAAVRDQLSWLPSGASEWECEWQRSTLSIEVVVRCGIGG